MRKLYFWLPAVLGLAAFLPRATAQPQSSPTVYTFVAMWQVPRAQWPAFNAAAMKNTVPILERLVADGTLLEFGLVTSVVHLEEAPSHSSWWSATSFSGVQKALAELQKIGMGPEFAGLKHRDRLLRSVVYRNPKSAKLTSGLSHLSTTYIQPGKAAQWRELFDKYTQPVYEKLLEDGVILGYGVDLEYVHTESPGARYMWYNVASGEAVDKVDAAVTAAQQKFPAEARRAIGAAFGEATVAGSHRDALDSILYYVHK